MMAPAHPERYPMVCPQCSHTNPDESVVCEECATPLPFDDQTLQPGSAGGWSVPVGNVTVTHVATKQLSSGTLLGERYEIIRLLGQGGMGAVYQARDRELDRGVALKVIRADMASNPQILRRFKQELILARQISHRNVIRIFDLGQAEGIRFITMEYIEGEDLQSVLRRKKKLEPVEAANIMAQVCRALEAAHAEGVIHRDLKPQNIMLDKSGRAYVMDFGIARLVQAAGMTQTGALIGTPDYMSPEQAKGLPLDARSDLFTFGIIFYEILSGEAPFNADTTMGKLWKRTTEPARPVEELDKAIPQPLSDIVEKCLEIDPQKRFASASEVLQEIEIWQGPQAGTRVVWTRPAQLPGYVKWATAGLAILLAVMGIALRSRFTTKPAAAHVPLTVLLADVENKTNDPIFDGTLEPLLSIALEGAPFISSYNRGQAHKEAAKLQNGATRLDESLARLVAVREGVSVVVAGDLSQEGGGYRLAVRAVDAATGKSISAQTMSASSKDQVLTSLSKLATRVRSTLGDTTPASAQRAAAETFTAASLEAAHAYAKAQEFQWEGKWDDAVGSYSRAVQLDPSFGRAYAGLAAMQNNLGHREEAVKYYQLALAQIDRMTPREKYRTRSGYYLAARDQEKAIEELSQLVEQFPSDSAGIANLALAYFYKRDMPRALEEGRRAVEISPKNVLQRDNLALYAMYAGDFDTAAREEETVLQLNPSFAKGLSTLALAQFAQGHIPQSTETYRRLQGLSAWGASQAAAGLADIALYEGRLSNAADILEKGVAGDLANKDAEGAANKLSTLAATLAAMGRKGAAVSAAERALAQSRPEGVLYVAALVYLEGGVVAKVRAVAAELSKHTEPDPQAYSKLVEGEILLARGSTTEAIQAFQQARKVADTWPGRFALGRAYLAAGKFTEAYTEFETCQKRRGEATSVFLEDLPTYHYYPPILYYFGRSQEGLKSSGAADSYKLFLAIKEKSEDDPLVADARRRLAAK
jgi:eukaryotic-like serine/threonine-protein kinase